MIMIRLGDKKIKEIYLGDKPVKAVYIGEKKIWPEKEYGDITIESFEYRDVEAAGGTSSPIIGAVEQAVTVNGHTTMEVLSSINSKARYDITDYSGIEPQDLLSVVEINHDTGVVTWTDNMRAARQVTVRLTVSANGRSATKDTACRQKAAAVDVIVVGSNGNIIKAAIT